MQNVAKLHVCLKRERKTDSQPFNDASMHSNLLFDATMPTHKRRFFKPFAVRVAIAMLLLMALPVAAETRAILIGVGRFDYLNITPLAGPVNDVVLMAATLRMRGIPEKNIVQLTDYAAINFLPRRANILRALKHAASASRVGDRVIVYLSGHGAQVPQPKGVPANGWIEPDGLDEVFLTRDTRMWDKKNQRVEGALLDDEIGDALAAFTRKGVHVWAIFDTCHAGDMARGGPSDEAHTIWRGVPPESLGVATVRWPLNTRVRMARSPTPPKRSGSLTTFYATQPDEASPEEMLPLIALARGDAPNRATGSEGIPLDNAKRVRYGVFTWHVANALNDGASSYVDLVQKINLGYDRRPFPTPLFDGALNVALPF